MRMKPVSEVDKYEVTCTVYPCFKIDVRRENEKVGVVDVRLFIML